MSEPLKKLTKQQVSYDWPGPQELGLLLNAAIDRINELEAKYERHHHEAHTEMIEIKEFWIPSTAAYLGPPEYDKPGIRVTGPLYTTGPGEDSDE